MSHFLFHVNRALSYLYLCSEMGVNQDSSLYGPPSYCLVHPCVLFTMVCRISILQIFKFFFGMCPVSQESRRILIHKHFLLLC